MNILRETSRDWLEIPVRAIAAFNREGVDTVGAVDDMTDAELLRIPGLGCKTLRQIREAVDRLRDHYHRGVGMFGAWHRPAALSPFTPEEEAVFAEVLIEFEDCLVTNHAGRTWSETAQWSPAALR